MAPFLHGPAYTSPTRATRKHLLLNELPAYEHFARRNNSPSLSLGGGP
jgi:hypothetical protein